MPHPRTGTSRVRFVVLAIWAFLIPGIFADSPGVRAQDGHMIPPQQQAYNPVGFKILSSSDGVDFLPYLSGLAGPLGNTFHAKIPKGAASDGKGVVVVRARIQRDGSLRDDAVEIVTSSANDDMDAAALSAVRAASPFRRLPEGYHAAYLDLQLRFYYHRTPPKPEPEPKVVPIVTAHNETVRFAESSRG